MQKQERRNDIGKKQKWIFKSETTGYLRHSILNLFTISIVKIVKFILLLPQKKYAYFGPNVSPLDILCESAAVCALWNSSLGIIKSERHFITQLGYRVVRLTTIRGTNKLRSAHTRKIGEAINRDLGVLLLNVVRSCERKEEKEQEKIKAMSAEMEL